MRFIFASLLICSIFLVSAPKHAQANEVKITVNGMVCSFCAQGIERQFKKQKGIENIDVRLEEKRVTLELGESANLSDEEINTLLQKAGYNVEKIERKE